MAEFVPQRQTVGVSSAVIPAGPSEPEDTVCQWIVHVFGWNHAAAVSYWRFQVLGKREIGNLMSGLVTQLAKNNSASASTWLAVGSWDVDGQFVITVTGGAGQTVDWLAINDDPLCMIGPFTP